MTTSTSTTPCTTGKSLFMRRIGDQAADAGNGEHRLDHHRAGEQAVHLQAEQRQQGHADIAQAVLPEDGAGRQALGAQGADILLSSSTSISALRTCRASSAMTPTASATAGKVACMIALQGSVSSGAAPVVGNQCSPSERVATRIMASQKLGNATPREASPVMNASSRVPTRVAASHAERHADHAGNHQRVNRDQQRVRQPVEDQLRDRFTGQQRAPEVALERMQEPYAVLDQERLIEAVELADLGDALLGCVVAGQHHRGIAGHQLQQREHHERGKHDDRQQLPEAPANQSQNFPHRGISLSDQRMSRSSSFRFSVKDMRNIKVQAESHTSVNFGVAGSPSL